MFAAAGEVFASEVVARAAHEGAGSGLGTEEGREADGAPTTDAIDVDSTGQV